jgi:hypothetical protein
LEAPRNEKSLRFNLAFGAYSNDDAKLGFLSL